ncbi:MAG: molybdopterin-synthase adenylyltransferase MoeB [Pseudomonadaceae bacterium]|nr:molybdopterin-synthase adenylyltransferase MoeB [Pseudomonadaceae bacterium]
MNDEELLRYSRQIMLPEIDIDGQQALLDAKVLIVGLGGLGSPAALYLAAAGVGTLVLCDNDQVELSNLQRQIAHAEASIGLDKTESAAASINRLNSDTTLVLESDGFSPSLVDGCTVVLDACDNFTTRYAVNDACHRARVPLVSGAAIRWQGQLAVFDFRKPRSACYRCLYREAQDADLDCATNGVAAPAVGAIGVLQALEAVKLICGAGEVLADNILYADFLSMDMRRFTLARLGECDGEFSCANVAKA